MGEGLVFASDRTSFHLCLYLNPILTSRGSGGQSWMYWLRTLLYLLFRAGRRRERDIRMSDPGALRQCHCVAAWCRMKQTHMSTQALHLFPSL